MTHAYILNWYLCLCCNWYN